MINSFDYQHDLDMWKVCVHFMMSLGFGMFTYVIGTTVYGSPHLHRNPHYLLLLQHYICLMAFNIVGCVLHVLRFLRLPVIRLVCWILFDLQVVMGSGITLTHTLMCMCMCLCVCWPLHCKALVFTLYRWGILVLWILALINPVVFTVLACTQQPLQNVTASDTEYSTALESKASISIALLLLSLMVQLMFGSYFLICLEGRRTGNFSQPNSKGQWTIFIHILQLSLHIIPSFIFISCTPQAFSLAIITFLMFSVSQLLSPVIYGLRCKELNREIPRFFPHFRCPALEPSMNMELHGGTRTIARSTRRGNRMATIGAHECDVVWDDETQHHVSEGLKESVV